MALASGTRLGPYEITALLGAGGMSEVYRARDTRLERIVAIKVLREHLAKDPGRRERFNREARAISKLNHLHICTLFDVGHDQGVDYLVVEYLEGQTLAERLQKGALPITQALQVAIDIAGALDAAHRVGIVHRDLKPANIMLTKAGAKLLDFGIARMTAASSTVTSATTQGTLTAESTLLGTVQYMAPEQLEGREAEATSDLFAFGAVVYEMLSGLRAFAGDTQASLIAAVLERDPKPLDTDDPAVSRLLRKCLAKDPEARWQTARDLRDELQWIADTRTVPVAATPPPRQRAIAVWISAVAVVSAATAGIVAVRNRAVPGDSRVLRSSFVPPADLTGSAAGRIALSPDGLRLAFTAPDAAEQGRPMLWVRRLDELTGQPLPGTEFASDPFWSPDGHFIGFLAQGKLKTINADGGAVLVLADARLSAPGSWSPSGTILYTPDRNSPIYQIPAAGGTSSPATRLEGSDVVDFAPFFLPDGRHFLYAVGTPSMTATGKICVGQIDSFERRVLLSGSGKAQYANGFLVFSREATVMAQPFDLGRLALTGAAAPVAQNVLYATAGQLPALSIAQLSVFSTSQTGTLAFQYGGERVGGGYGDLRLRWFDRSGHEIGTLGDAGPHKTEVNLSRDGRHATMVKSTGNASDVWLVDNVRGVSSRFTFGPGTNSNPVWSPDGRRVIFSSDRNGSIDLFEKPSDGSEPERLLYADRHVKIAESVSPDGQYLTYWVNDETSANHSRDIWVLPLRGKKTSFPLTQTPYSENQSQFSPDGRWVAYDSDESGQREVYVVPFPGPGPKVKVSTDGGGFPRWNRNGHELFFVGPQRTLSVASVRVEDGRFNVGATHPLFDLRLSGPSVYDVAPDGQRFLVHTRDGEPAIAPITLVVNWPFLLKH